MRRDASRDISRFGRCPSRRRRRVLRDGRRARRAHRAMRRSAVASDRCAWTRYADHTSPSPLIASPISRGELPSTLIACRRSASSSNCAVSQSRVGRAFVRAMHRRRRDDGRAGRTSRSRQSRRDDAASASAMSASVTFCIAETTTICVVSLACANQLRDMADAVGVGQRRAAELVRHHRRRVSSVSALRGHADRSLRFRGSAFRLKDRCSRPHPRRGAERSFANYLRATDRTTSVVVDVVVVVANSAHDRSETDSPGARQVRVKAAASTRRAAAACASRRARRARCRR